MMVNKTLPHQQGSQYKQQKTQLQDQLKDE